MNKDVSVTRVFSAEDIKREVIRSNLQTVVTALEEKGYNAVHQIAGYLISQMIPLIFQVTKAHVLLFSKWTAMRLLKN